MNSSCYTFDFQGASTPALGETRNGWRFTFYFMWTVTRAKLLPRRTCSFRLFPSFFSLSSHLHDASNLDESVSRQARGGIDGCPFFDRGNVTLREILKLRVLV